MGTRRREGRPASAMARSAGVGSGQDGRSAWGLPTWRRRHQRTASRSGRMAEGAGPGGVGASRRSGGRRCAGRGPHHRPAPGGQDVSRRAQGQRRRSRHQECPRPGKDLWLPRGERGERPVAGTDEASQADPAGSHAVRTANPHVHPAGDPYQEGHRPRTTRQDDREAVPPVARLGKPAPGTPSTYTQPSRWTSDHPQYRRSALSEDQEADSVGETQVEDFLKEEE